MHLVVSDFDGTLLIDGTVDPSVIQAIVDFRMSGNLFAVCTGRPIHSVLEQLEHYQIPYDYVMGVNGATAMDSNNNILYTHDLNPEAVQEIARLLELHNVKGYYLSNGFDQIIVNGSEGLEKHDAVYDAVRAYYVESFDARDALMLTDEVNLELKPMGITAYPNNQYVAIGKSGIHKGHAVQSLIELIKWDGAVHVVGDDYNDIPMFKRFNSFGITSGVKEAIAYTTHKVSSVKEMLDQITQ